MTNSAKNWCLTLNNPTDDCLQYDASLMHYLICGLEVGEQGTKHLQGYVQMKSRKTLSQMKDLFVGAHLEIAKGNQAQNIEYCSKDGLVHDHGKPTGGQGKRSDLLAVKKLIDETRHLSFGERLERLREEHYSCYIRSHRSITKDLSFTTPKRNFQTLGFVHWGETGTGKSTTLFEKFPNAYWKPYGKWWDGYCGQEIVIIDEFYGWLPFNMLQRLLDKFPMSVETKGGTQEFVSKEIHFTSNVEYVDWYTGVAESIRRSLDRRFEGRVIRYNKLN